MLVNLRIGLPTKVLIITLYAPHQKAAVNEPIPENFYPLVTMHIIYLIR